MKTTGIYSQTEDPFDIDQEINIYSKRLDEIITTLTMYQKSDANSIKKALINQLVDSMET